MCAAEQKCAVARTLLQTNPLPPGKNRHRWLQTCTQGEVNTMLGAMPITPASTANSYTKITYSLKGHWQDIHNTKYKDLAIVVGLVKGKFSILQ
jgi:hypothetical protein